MTRLIDDDERRARLGRRHLLADGHRAETPADVANALTAIHSTDHTSTVLGVLARTSSLSIPDVERALYLDRSIVRVLGMRRTMFAVDYRLAPAVWSSFDSTVARDQERLLVRYMQAAGIDDPAGWIEESQRRLLAFLADNPQATSAEIGEGDPYLSARLPIAGPGDTLTTQSVASRLLTLLSAKGIVLRGQPRGSWTSSQVSWVETTQWRNDWPDRPGADDGDLQIARSWLAGYAPATLEDLAWWTGWPKGRSRKALDRAGAIEVQTSAGPGFVLPDDVDPVESAVPWVALLPGLDSSTMGWKNRSFYLGDHAKRVFDNVGNGGPTVWVDGRIVGGWAHRDSGEVAFEVFDDVGREALLAIETRADQLESILKDVRIKPRARRYTASERSLL